LYVVVLFLVFVVLQVPFILFGVEFEVYKQEEEDKLHWNPGRFLLHVLISLRKECDFVLVVSRSSHQI